MSGGKKNTTMTESKRLLVMVDGKRQREREVETDRERDEDEE